VGFGEATLSSPALCVLRTSGYGQWGLQRLCWFILKLRGSPRFSLLFYQKKIHYYYREYTLLGKGSCGESECSLVTTLNKNPHVDDDTDHFPHLHAGMLLSDGERITTSGCPVFHPNDANQSFTIAAHGFVTGAEVRHPSETSRIIKIAEKKFGETDISHCCITDSRINHTVDCFARSNDDIMVKEEEGRIGKELFFDSPLTGLGTRYIVARSRNQSNSI
jgi:hypothetical protein